MPYGCRSRRKFILREQPSLARDFVWNHGKIYRLGFSDAVHYARRLQNERYLLVEFTLKDMNTSW